MFRRLAPLLILVPLIPAALAHAADHTVTTSGNTYAPKTVTVQPGDVVTWTNGGGSHNVVFDDGSYRSGNPTTNAELGSRAFEETGTLAYRCEVHGSSGMTGTVVVGGATGTPTPAPSATASPPPGASPTPSPSPGPPGATATPSPEPGAAPPVLGEIRFRRTVKGGRLRGSVAAEPVGAQLAVVAERSGAPAGRFDTETTAARTRVSIKLRRKVRRALAAGRRPRVRLTITLTTDGGNADAVRTLRLRAA